MLNILLLKIIKKCKKLVICMFSKWCSTVGYLKQVCRVSIFPFNQYVTAPSLTSL